MSTLGSFSAKRVVYLQQSSGLLDWDFSTKPVTDFHSIIHVHVFLACTRTVAMNRPHFGEGHDACIHLFSPQTLVSLNLVLSAVLRLCPGGVLHRLTAVWG